MDEEFELEPELLNEPDCTRCNDDGVQCEACGCQVCASKADLDLLLMCDECEYAFHTYCVGLGNVVPDGDWFCRHCRRDDDIAAIAG